MQNPLRMAARILTGSTYAVLGFESLRAPGPRVAMAGSTLTTLRRVVPLPENDELIVRANSAAQLVGGAVLLTGRFQRTAAAVLVGSMVPTTFAGHAFWTIDDPAARKAQRVQFQKNIAMIGGLLFAVVD